MLPLNFGPTALSPLSQGYMGVAPKQTIAEEAKSKKSAGKTAPAPYKQDYSFTAPGMFPGVSDKDKNILMSMTQNIPPAQRTQVQEELFSQALPVIQNRELKNQRSESRQQMMYEMSKEADPMKRKSINFAMKTSEFADMIKEKNQLPMQIPDQEMMDAFFQEQPDAVESFTNWINKGDPELLYNAGLKERPKTGLAKTEEDFFNTVDKFEGKMNDPNLSTLGKVGAGVGGLAQVVMNPVNQALGYGMEKAYEGAMAIDKAAPAVTQYAPMLNPIAAVSNAVKDIGAIETGGFTFEGQPQTIKDSVTSFAGGNIQKASEWFDGLKQTNPELHNAIESGLPIADAIMTFTGLGAAKAPIKKAGVELVESVAKGAKSITKPGALKGAMGITNGITNPVDSLAARLTKTASGQDKLFKAQSPTLNVLNKNRNFKTVRAESDMANDLIVKAGHSPVDTETRRIAHEATMKSKRAEVERAIGSKKDTMVDQNPFADILDGVIKDAKKSGLVKNSNDIKALEAEARAMRKQGSIDLPSLEKKKQYINGIVNNRGDSAVGDVYKNGMKQVTRAIGQAEDDLLSKIPGSFQKLKNEFGSLKGTYEDVLKADLKNQKAKGMNIMESYSRIEGIGDILGGTIGLFSRGSQGLADVGKGIGKFVMGKSLKKANDVDYLIENGFKDLISKNKGNVPIPTIPSNLPTIPKRTPVTKPLSNTPLAPVTKTKGLTPATKTTKELQPLYDEARKYKNADDFVNDKMADGTSVRSISRIKDKARDSDIQFKSLMDQYESNTSKMMELKTNFHRIRDKIGFTEGMKNPPKELIDFNKSYDKIYNNQQTIKESIDKIKDTYSELYFGKDRDKADTHFRKIREQANKR